MAHDITESDGMVLVGKPAWHGLGRVVESAPTPAEALMLARLNWTVDQWPMTATDGEGIRTAIESHVANVRSDTKEVLGVVGKGWQPIQNAELAEFATALAADGDTVRVETAASIQGGRRVWFLLRGQSFSVKGFDDTVTPYLLLAMGHDGSLALHVKPTSIRTVCCNTLNLALGEKSAIQLRIKHEGDVMGKLDEARRVLGLYRKQEQAFEERVNMLAARTMSREDLQRFFLDVYSEAYEPIPAEGKTEKARKVRQEAQQTIAAWGRKYDQERASVGDTAWAALNATTHYMQHVDHVRGKDQHARNANRLYSRLFGTIEDRTNKAAKLAMSLV